MSDHEMNLNGTTPEEELTPAMEGDQANTQEPGERTFTQDEINRIISRRVAEERAKADAVLAQREAEIVQREYEYHVQTVIKEKKLPLRLLDALKGGDKATFDASVAIIEELLDVPFKEAVQAAVIDRMRGSGAPTVIGANPPTKEAVIRGAMGLEGRK